jgi:type VI secretion system protein VasI
MRTLVLILALSLASCATTPQEAVISSPVVVTQIVTQVVTQEVERTVIVIVTATPRPATPTPVVPTETPAPAMGKWMVENDTSSFDDSPTVILTLEAEEEIQGAVQASLPALILRCKEKVVEAYVFTGQIPDVEGVSDTVSIRYRFDQGSALPGQADKSTDGEALFFQAPQEFIERMLEHERLVFGFTPFGAPPAEMTFDLRGLSEAIAPLNEACKA